jgi:glycosyltransferase involved in cell wall biosynthesis
VISVVIPTFNRRERLARVLDALDRQEGDVPFEVIVVSDGSTDGTDDFLRGLDTPLDLHAHFQPNSGPAAARNRGVASARSDLVLFIDDDVVPAPNLIRAHLEVRAHVDPATVVIGPMRDPADHRMTSWVAWEQEMLAKQYEAMEAGRWQATARQFYTGNASLPVEIMQRAGGFDTGFTRAEDIELAFRLHDLGAGFEYAPDATGWHYAERSYESWCAAAYAYGRNDIRFGRDLDRPKVYALIAWTFGRRNLLLKVVALITIHSAPLGRAERRLFELLVVPHPSGSRRRLVRYALSAVYAERYYRGLTDELGSSRRARQVLRTPLDV